MTAVNVQEGKTMFLNHLQEEQKKAFLALALKMMHADEVTDPREELIFLSMRREMGFWQETRLPQGTVEDLASLFTDRKSQRIVMLELLGMVYADERFQEQEQRLLRGLARLFDISEEEATKLENWVLRQIELNKEALHFLQ